MSDVLLSFTVPGCPVPKVRQAHHGRKEARGLRSLAYEKHVAWMALDAANAAGFRTIADEIRGAQWFVDTYIYVPDRRGRDADNINKAIADGLVKSRVFDVDTGFRMLPRAQRYELEPTNPRVDVVIRRAR